MKKKEFKIWAVAQIDKGNEEEVMKEIKNKIKKIYWLSQESENRFSIDGTNYIIEIKEALW